MKGARGRGRVLARCSFRHLPPSQVSSAQPSRYSAMAARRAGRRWREPAAARRDCGPATARRRTRGALLGRQWWRAAWWRSEAVTEAWSSATSARLASAPPSSGASAPSTRAARAAAPPRWAAASPAAPGSRRARPAPSGTAPAARPPRAAARLPAEGATRTTFGSGRGWRLALTSPRDCVPSRRAWVAATARPPTRPPTYPPPSPRPGALT